jgi:hypothetical protein
MWYRLAAGWWRERATATIKWMHNKNWRRNSLNKKLQREVVPISGTCFGFGVECFLCLLTRLCGDVSYFTSKSSDIQKLTVMNA